MRIIAGEFRHRKLISPPDATTTRPIPDRVKEALFNLLRGWTEDAVVLDVFAGTGAIFIASSVFGRPLAQNGSSSFCCAFATETATAEPTSAKLSSVLARAITDFLIFPSPKLGPEA